jgi:hypothetical protein
MRDQWRMLRSVRASRPLRLLELAFCVAHPTAPDAVELRICGHAESQT